MPSITDIANLALTKLGPGTGYITDYETDTSVQAQAARRTYESVRDTVLDCHPWRFARTRTNLAADATAPAWGFAYQYTLPGDCLRVLSIEGEQIPYETEGGKLLCDEAGPLYVRYLARVTDTGKFTPTFIQALATRWAAEMAMMVVKSGSMRRDLIEEFERVDLSRARKSEHIGAVPEQASNGHWVNSRL